MKEIFPGYNKKTEDEIKNLWENGMILFDANVLLNLYRYSNETRKIIVDLISEFKDQIWLPHQSALEYNRNRYEVIADQEKAYKEFTEKITQIQKDLQSTSKPPFLSEKVHENLNKVLGKVSSEVKGSIKKYCDYLKYDPIYDKLSRLFNGKISKAYNDDKLKNLYREGKERFDKKIPPGYEDDKNKKGNRKFGDFILWMQVIDKAKESKSPIIFITDERKKDWWWLIRDGRNMGPRQELIEEIMEKANVDFHMYSSERFLSYGQDFFKGQVNEEALKEIQAMKKAEIEHIRKIKRQNEKILRRNTYEKDKKHFFKEKQNELENSIYKINSLENSLKKSDIENEGIQEYLHNLNIQKAEIQNELNEINKKLHSIESDDWELVSNDLRDFSTEKSVIRNFFRNRDENTDYSN